ncbi:MAG: ubiquinol-cytochrome C chaperone family protein [Candidatus Pelagibacter sp.]
MKYNYTNIYNNLIKLTRNKKLYVKLGKQDTFSDRLIIFFFHFAIFLKYYKSSIPSNKLQELFDFVIKQIEISIREVGYGDVSVNKKMKDFINIFYSLLEKIELLDLSKKERELQIYRNYLNIDKNLDFYADYFNKYRLFLRNNTLNNFTKDIINLNF